jgi:hypothetical protein
MWSIAPDARLLDLTHDVRQFAIRDGPAGDDGCATGSWPRMGQGKGGPIVKVRRTIPLVVPLTMNAIVNAEDTIDAMDLRAFGTGRRTWLRELIYDRTDRLILAGVVTLLVAFTVLGFAGISSTLYVFPFLLDLAGA